MLPRAHLGVASPVLQVAQAEARDEQSKYIKFQRSQREQIFTGSAHQPVGGRAARQYQLSSRQDDWSAEDEKAFQKAFGKSSTTREASRPTGA